MGSRHRQVRASAAEQRRCQVIRCDPPECRRQSLAESREDGALARPIGSQEDYVDARGHSPTPEPPPSIRRPISDAGPQLPYSARQQELRPEGGEEFPHAVPFSGQREAADQADVVSTPEPRELSVTTSGILIVELREPAAVLLTERPLCNLLYQVVSELKRGRGYPELPISTPRRQYFLATVEDASIPTVVGRDINREEIPWCASPIGREDNVVRRGLVLHPLHDRSPEPISIRPQERRELPRQEISRHDAVYVGDHSGRGCSTGCRWYLRAQRPIGAISPGGFLHTAAHHSATRPCYWGSPSAAESESRSGLRPHPCALRVYARSKRTPREPLGAAQAHCVA